MDSRPLELKSVSKEFAKPKGQGTVDVLDDVSIHIAQDETVCFIGPSGCGKSTILSMAAGFDAPSSGSVLSFGKPVKSPDRRRTVVFQSPVLYPWMTIRENILLVGQGKGFESSAEELAERAEQVVADVGLADFYDYYPYQLSGGMKQRAQLARALASRPELLLMDEPFGALDAQTRLLMQEMLQDMLLRYKQSAMFITHDIQEALILADRIYVMSGRPGRIIDEIKLDWERPRRLRDIRGKRFDELEVHMIDLLHG